MSVLTELVAGQTGRTSTSVLLVGGDNDTATGVELPD